MTRILSKLITPIWWGWWNHLGWALRFTIILPLSKSDRSITITSNKFPFRSAYHAVFKNHWLNEREKNQEQHEYLQILHYVFNLLQLKRPVHFRHPTPLFNTFHLIYIQSLCTFCSRQPNFPTRAVTDFSVSYFNSHNICVCVNF